MENATENVVDPKPIIRFQRVYRHGKALVMCLPKQVRVQLGIQKGTPIRIESDPLGRSLKMEVMT